MCIEKPDLDNFADRLNHVIKALQIKKEDFAKGAKCSVSYLNKLLGGFSKNPSDNFLFDIQAEYGVSASWLKYGKGEAFLPGAFEYGETRIYKNFHNLSKADQDAIAYLINSLIIKNNLVKLHGDENPVPLDELSSSD